MHNDIAPIEHIPSGVLHNLKGVFFDLDDTFNVFWTLVVIQLTERDLRWTISFDLSDLMASVTMKICLPRAPCWRTKIGSERSAALAWP
jgi:hypothetical protein